jgi:hypothetical protein
MVDFAEISKSLNDFPIPAGEWLAYERRMAKLMLFWRDCG